MEKADVIAKLEALNFRLIRLGVWAEDNFKEAVEKGDKYKVERFMGYSTALMEFRSMLNDEIEKIMK